MKERLVALTVLLVGVALASAAPPPMAVVAIVISVVGVVTGPRFRVDRVGQAALAIGAMVLGVVAPRVLLGIESSRDDPTVLGERTLLLATPVLAVAAVRTVIDSPVFGARLTLTAALVALTAAGRALSGNVYPVLAALAVATGLAALHASDPVRPSLRLLGPRHVGAILFGGAVAAALAITSAEMLPRLHDTALARFLARYGRHRTGFSNQMFLGEMTGMLASDVVVMRVRGGAPPLLRGAVFTAYAAGRWETDALLTGIEVVETPGRPAGSALVEIENAKKSLRYFLPLGARDVVVGTGVYERDVLQIHRPSRKFEAKRIWFADGGGPQPAPPRPADLLVPKRVMPALSETLRAWNVTGRDPRARVDAIVERLTNDYRYSLSFDRKPGVDPVVDFLTRSREGHCEYFASAAALLARAADVPARVAAGYRVAESSPFGYHVVRERHAHSWAEVWIDDRWVTIDPTPAADLALSSPASMSAWSALVDGLSTAWERVDDWLGQRSAFEMSLILVGLVALLLVARALRGRVRGDGAPALIDVPLPGFVALARALARRGVSRAPHETLSRFARRIEREARLPAPLEATCAELVRRYESLRYAGRGDAGALEREMDEAARLVARAAAAKPSPVPSSPEAA